MLYVPDISEGIDFVDMKRKGTLLDFCSKRHKPEDSIELFPSQLKPIFPSVAPVLIS